MTVQILQRRRPCCGECHLQGRQVRQKSLGTVVGGGRCRDQAWPHLGLQAHKGSKICILLPATCCGLRWLHELLLKHGQLCDEAAA